MSNLLLWSWKDSAQATPFVASFSELLRDDFSVDAAAPLTNPRSCDVVGTFTFAGTFNASSIFDGKLHLTTAQQGEFYDDVGRPDVAGLATFLKGGATSGTSGLAFGWDGNKSGTPTERWNISRTGTAPTDNWGIALGLVDSSQQNQFVVVRQGDGAYAYFVRNKEGNWYISSTDLGASGTAYAGVRDTSITTYHVVDTFRVLRLGNPLETPFGWNTFFKSVVGNGDSFDFPSDFWARFQVTVNSSGAKVRIHFRIKDLGVNYHELLIEYSDFDGSANIQLGRYANGVLVASTSTGLTTHTNQIVSLTTYANRLTSFSESGNFVANSRTDSNYQTFSGFRVVLEGNASIINLYGSPRDISGTKAGLLLESIL